MIIITVHGTTVQIYSEQKISIFIKDRHVAVRQPDGTLRKAHWEERDRINFIFFPKEGQSYRLPKVLQDEHLQVCFALKIIF